MWMRVECRGWYMVTSAVERQVLQLVGAYVSRAGKKGGVGGKSVNVCESGPSSIQFSISSGKHQSKETKELNVNVNYLDKWKIFMPFLLESYFWVCLSGDCCHHVIITAVTRTTVWFCPPLLTLGERDSRTWLMSRGFPLSAVRTQRSLMRKKDEGWGNIWTLWDGKKNSM